MVGILLFGANLEKRTALRRVPRTDLGVFSVAAWAARSGENLYSVHDWHGWHYHYPPTLAILFAPLAHPLPAPLPALAVGETRNGANTPWGYEVDSGGHYFGYHQESARFFWIVAVWYFLSVLFVFGSAHALACALEGKTFRTPPPLDEKARSRWWGLRLLPLLVCAGSIGTDFSRGQVDVLMLAAVALGLYFAAIHKEIGAGLCFAFPATVKLFPPLLLIYPFWRRRWRMAAGILGGLIFALFVIPGVALGPNRTVQLYRNWFDVLAKPALGQGTDTSRAGELTGMGSTDNQSLLAAIHNWRFHRLPRDQRPQAAPPEERYSSYIIGGILTIGIMIAGGLRRRDSPQIMIIIAGLLIGLAFVVSPIVHNYYYLLMLPLVAALLDRAVPLPGKAPDSKPNWRLLLPVIAFAVVDLMARLPGIGAWLRDAGFPLLSLIALMFAGAAVLFKAKEAAESDLASQQIHAAS